MGYHSIHGCIGYRLLLLGYLSVYPYRIQLECNIIEWPLYKLRCHRNSCRRLEYCHRSDHSGHAHTDDLATKHLQAQEMATYLDIFHGEQASWNPQIIILNEDSSFAPIQQFCLCLVHASLV